MTGRYLLRLIKTELLIRDQGTFLGFLWTLLNPIFLFITLYFVFARKLSDGTSTYGGYLLTGILLWNFFSTASVHGAHSIARRGNYIANAPIPPSLFIVSSILALLVSTLFESFLAFTLLSLHLTISLQMIIHYIVGLSILTAFSIGIASLLSIARIFIADVTHLWSLLLRIGFFVTPVFYTPQSVEPLYLELLSYNPLTTLFTYARSPFMTDAQSASNIGVLMLFIIAFSMVGIVLVQRFRYRLVEG